MPTYVSSKAARRTVLVLVSLGGLLSTVALLVAATGVVDGVASPKVRSTFGSLSQLYFPAIAQIAAYYWGERNGDQPARQLHLEALLVTMIILGLYALVPAGIIGFVPSIEDSSQILLEWKVSFMTL